MPPGELLFNRNKRVVRRHGEAKERDEKRQSYNEQYADKRRHAKKSPIRIDDSVLIRQEKRNKLTANFNNQPYTVTSRKNCKVTATNKGEQTVKRNVSDYKQIPRTTSNGGDDSDDSEDYSTPTKEPNQVIAGHERAYENQRSEDQKDVGKGPIDMDTIFGHKLVGVSLEFNTLWDLFCFLKKGE